MAYCMSQRCLLQEYKDPNEKFSSISSRKALKYEDNLKCISNTKQTLWIIEPALKIERLI